jgi:hybrid cluster-associated redox disulfide protein
MGNNSNKQNDTSDWIKIDPNISMAELVTKYPELVEPLTYDYGLHCVNCMISDFDTLKQGAVIHGIEGKEFDEMLQDIENIINGEERE